MIGKILTGILVAIILLIGVFWSVMQWNECKYNGFFNY